MAIYGPYTGNPNKSISYKFCLHWKGKLGYKVVQGKSQYNHMFGGCKWTVPKCDICGHPYHQIFTFDLNDPKLKDLKMYGIEEIPLISCLNCSNSWETQIFRITKDKEMKLLYTEDTKNGHRTLKIEFLHLYQR